MTKKIKRRLASLLLILQINLSFFLPLSPFLQTASAAAEPEIEFSYNDGLDSLIVNPGHKLDYAYYYANEGVLESSQGELTSGENALYIGTQSGEDFVAYDFENLVFKAANNKSYFLTKDDGQVEVEKITTAEDLALNEAEEAWLFWQVDEDSKKAVTRDVVVQNKSYVFPLNNEIKVTFTKLPEETSPLSIREVKLSAELAQKFGVEVAYDITTDMENGSFEFDLELPKPEELKDVSAEKITVLHAADEQELEQKAEEAEQVENEIDGEPRFETDEEIVTIKKLDHMSIYVIPVEDIESYPVTICHHTPGHDVTLTFSNEQSYSGHINSHHDEHVYDTAGACDESAEVKKLNLTSMCTYDLTVRRWRVRNPNDFEVEVRWLVYGSKETGSYLAPSGDSFFITQDAGGANTTKIYWYDEAGKEQSQTKASNNQLCEFSCGDGIAEGPEECDFGDLNGQSSCSTECTWVNACHENMLANQDFEMPAVTNDKKWNVFTSAEIPGWTAEWVGSTTEYGGDTRPNEARVEFHAGVNGWTTADDQYVELDGDWQGPGGNVNGEPASIALSQTIPTTPGYHYSLSWDYSPRPNHDDNHLQVSVNGTEVFNTGSIAGGSNLNWQTETYEFTADQELTTITFTELGEGDSLGMFLDNVQFDCEPTSAVTVCKVDENQQPQAGWTVMLKKSIAEETVEVVPDGGVYSSSNMTEDDYILTAHGSYEYRGNSGLLTDPGYSERYESDGYSGPYEPWINVMDLNVEGALGIKVNGNPTNWGEYNDAHYYSLAYPAYSGSFDFSVYDGYTADNVGSMYVDIYQGKAGVTGEDGCYTFENVEYGNYEVEEKNQENWQPETGLRQKLVVDDPQETVEFVNEYVGPGTLNIKKYACADAQEAGLTAFTVNGTTYNETQFRPTVEGLVNGTAFADLDNDSFSGCYLQENVSFAIDQHPQDESGAGQPTGPVVEVGEFTTDANGEIVLDDLSTDGRYEVREQLADEEILGFACYRDGAGHGNTTNGGEYALMNDDNQAYCIAFNQEPTGDVVGFKYHDFDENGELGQDEGKLANWTIELYDEQQQLLDSQLTDAEGNYSFTALEPGNYQVCEVNQTGWYSTEPGNAQYCQDVTVVAGEEQEVNFGNKQIPVYDGEHVCPANTVETYVDTITLDSEQPTPVSYSLAAETAYLFKAHGTYEYANNRQRLADPAYGTVDGFATTRNDIGLWGTNRGVTSILGDLGQGMGIIEWDDDTQVNENHEYQKLFRTREALDAKFVISDWYSSWYSNNCQNQSCMHDNSGELEVDVYECVEDTTPPEVPENLGFNSHVADYSQRPVEIECGGYTNINQVSHHWTEVTDAVEYQRQWVYPGNDPSVEANWHGAENWATAYTNYRTFGGNPGTEGLWHVRVRARDEAGNWSDYSDACAITYDETAPEASSWYNPTTDFFTRLTDYTNETVDMQFVQNPATDIDHYEYQYRRADLDGAHLGTNILTMTGVSCTAGVCTWNAGFSDGAINIHRFRAVDKAGNKGAWSNWNDVDEATFGALAYADFTYDDFAAGTGAFADASYVAGNGGYSIREQVLPTSEITNLDKDVVTDETSIEIDYQAEDQDTEVKNVSLYQSYNGGAYTLIETQPQVAGAYTVDLDVEGEYCFYTQAEDIADDLTLDYAIGNLENVSEKDCEMRVQVARTGQVTVCKEDPEGTLLSGWEMNLSQETKELVETITLQADDYDGVDTSVLTAGEEYEIVVEGTWNNNTRLVDAEYYSDDSWTTQEDMADQLGRDDRQLDVVLDNNDVAWGVYDGDHKYVTQVLGGDAVVNVRVYDEDLTPGTSWYRDNQGSLTIKVYRLGSVDYSDNTDENGCVTFEVETGDYVLTETMQQNWARVEVDEDDTVPENGEVTVGPLDELIYTFVNQYQEEREGNPTETPTPTPTPIQENGQVTGSTAGGDGGGDGGGDTSPATYSCDAAKPGLVTNFAVAASTANSVTLTWDPADGVNPGDGGYGLFFTNTRTGQVYGASNIGYTNTYTINGISGGDTYVFRIFAINDCMPGDESTLSTLVTGPVLATRPVGPEGEVLGVEDEEGEGEGQQQEDGMTEQEREAAVKGTQDNACSTFKINILWILLVIQLIAILGVDYKYKTDDSKKKHFIAAGTTVLSIIAFYIFSDCDCYGDTSLPALLCRWYWLVSMVETGLAKLFSYGFIETVEKK